MEATKKVWTESEIKANLATSKKWVERAIMAIYEKQTADEKQAGETKHNNGIGFSGSDSVRGSYMAKWIQAGKQLDGEWVEKARKMALKYVKQLAAIANGKI